MWYGTTDRGKDSPLFRKNAWRAARSDEADRVEIDCIRRIAGVLGAKRGAGVILRGIAW